ncbi:MAG: hypothetical protein A3B99_01650 [Candidatus Yanofskybacteria bacterium RIFCSPHIGHO2_02_FULL_44_12b]|uniref:Uncharacterized protein n=2 Tax=Candidatus Yanofskyibacteriota TaxID=1752733 RepID=A0A1F8GLP4_9BACT|nr:MAG: hypothetical protein UW79_C0020G0004 [Candidatus Yanofskybacteria bacterium GW2011_GWA2_44_9]OGN04890.1 MAG: hypothetical protein A2659_04790 [Candidatus Yanofskybacteria bacterium RIFCSPHIGHO2_01_FULL_44_24]OGN16237.1 MAG: hypothetical protein A3B99_01650 [Candidatus Yanofskybacteria bacterium RIFCSPHIGHO2_02_FULL_44_12b]OGN25586.1 MAG: hypothetical protein A2925_05195 [Candidatus Yanofskybacteria bacterium RIFCSPLOWO2_01_FULL_44_22]
MNIQQKNNVILAGTLIAFFGLLAVGMLVFPSGNNRQVTKSSEQYFAEQTSFASKVYNNKRQGISQGVSGIALYFPDIKPDTISINRTRASDCEKWMDYAEYYFDKFEGVLLDNGAQEFVDEEKASGEISIESLVQLLFWKLEVESPDAYSLAMAYFQAFLGMVEQFMDCEGITL